MRQDLKAIKDVCLGLCKQIVKLYEKATATHRCCGFFGWICGNYQLIGGVKSNRKTISRRSICLKNYLKPLQRSHLLQQ